MQKKLCKKLYKMPRFVNGISDCPDSRRVADLRRRSAAQICVADLRRRPAAQICGAASLTLRRRRCAEFVTFLLGIRRRFRIRRLLRRRRCADLRRSRTAPVRALKYVYKTENIVSSSKVSLYLA